MRVQPRRPLFALSGGRENAAHGSGASLGQWEDGVEPRVDLAVQAATGMALDDDGSPESSTSRHGTPALPSSSSPNGEFRLASGHLRG